MPRTHPSLALDAQLVGYIKDYEGNDVGVDTYLIVGDRDFSHRVEEWDLSWESGNAPWTLSCSIVGKLPSILRNAPVRFDFDIGGILFTGLIARASRPEPSDVASTTLVAWTPGFLLDKVALREVVPYSDVVPQTAIRDAVYRVPFYDRARVVIPRFDTPFFRRIEGDAFQRDQYPADILAAVAEEIDCVYADTQLGGFKSLKHPGIGTGIAPSWEYEFDAPDVYEWVEPAFMSPDEQFTEVRVLALNEDGSVRLDQSWPVDYTSLPYPPAAGQTFFISPSDATDEADDNARALAVETAETLRHGTYEGSMLVAFNPRHQPYDLVTVYEEHEDDEGRYERLWRCLLTGIAHRGPTETATELSFTATLARERKISEPPSPIGFLSPGIVNITGLKPSQGLKPSVGLKPRS